MRLVVALLALAGCGAPVIVAFAPDEEARAYLAHFRGSEVVEVFDRLPLILEDRPGTELELLVTRDTPAALGLPLGATTLLRVGGRAMVPSNRALLVDAQDPRQLEAVDRTALELSMLRLPSIDWETHVGEGGCATRSIDDPASFALAFDCLGVPAVDPPAPPAPIQLEIERASCPGARCCAPGFERRTGVISTTIHFPRDYPSPTEELEVDDVDCVAIDDASCPAQLRIPGGCVTAPELGCETETSTLPRVDLQAAAGGDGSASRPFSTIDEALLAGAREVQLLAGVYTLPVALPPELALTGRCPRDVTIAFGAPLSTRLRVRRARVGPESMIDPSGQLELASAMATALTVRGVLTVHDGLVSDVRVIDGALTLRASRSSSISGAGTIEAQDGFVRTLRVLGATVALARVVIDGPQSVIAGSLVAEDVEFRVGLDSAGWVLERTRAALARVSFRATQFRGPQMLWVGEGAELVAEDLAFRTDPELGLAEAPWGRGVAIGAGGRAEVRRMLAVGVGGSAVSVEVQGTATVEDATLLGTGGGALESYGTLTADRVRVGGSENQALYVDTGQATVRDLYVTWNHARAVVVGRSSIVEVDRVRVLGAGDGALSVAGSAVLRARSVETRLTSQSRCAGSCNDTLAVAGEARLEVERFITHGAARGLRLENESTATLRDGQLDCEDAFVIGASNAAAIEAPELWLQNVAVSAAQELFRIVPD